MRRALALSFAALCALSACTRGQPASKSAEAEDATASESVELEGEAAAAIITAVAEAAEAPAEIAALGRVLDPAVLVEVAGALASARVGATAAERDLARTRTLARDHANASDRELAAAELAASQARGALAQAQTRALASFGTSDAARVAEFAGRLARGELALARLELPAGAELPGPRDEIHVFAPALGVTERRARVIGPAGTLDASLQGPAVLVALAPSPPPAGAALEARIALGAPLHGVWLPESAVSWSEGEPIAFVASGDAKFARRTLTLARPLRDGYLATAGVAAGERVVTSGAQQLLSSQLVSGEADED